MAGAASKPSKPPMAVMPNRDAAMVREPPKSTSPTRGTPASNASGALFHAKVISLAIRSAEGGKNDTKDAAINMLPVTTLDFQKPNLEAFISNTTLEQIRGELGKILNKDQHFKFCTTDCSTVADTLTIEAYLALLHINGPAVENVVEIYIAAIDGAKATSASALQSPPFVIKFIQVNGGSGTSEGSLHSSAFKGKDPSSLLLGELRKLIGTMSQDSDMHTFCSTDGTAVTDGLPLGEYLNIDDEPIRDESGVPSIIVRFRKAGAVKAPPETSSKFHGASPEVLAMMENMNHDLSFKDRSSEELKMDTSEFRVQEQIDPSQFAARDANPVKYTSQMDENDWNAVLRSCSLLYGWRIDKKTNQIERARTPAFQLRSNLFIPPVAPLSSKIDKDAGDVEKSSRSAYSTIKEVDSDESDDQYEEDADDDTASYDEVDVESNSDAQSRFSSSSTLPAEPLIERITKAEDINATLPRKPGAVPSFAINDASKIEIAIVSHEFQKSMAENHFSASTFEASVSGGYAGFSVGVSGGMSSESASGKASSSKTFSKTMVASYKFPRVTVFLRPQDLEPTPELQASLALIKKTKNINALRKMYETFGHLFCHEVTLGGCLQTTKVVTGTQQTDSTMEKEGFKASVGVAVQTPIGVGGSMKASHETQDKKENEQKQTDSREVMVFEATGGNTILAADPPAWSSSVADFNNWRVIDQKGLSPIIDTLADIPGYQQVRQWFLQAVPKLSEYIVIPESRMFHVRFKAMLGNDSLERMTGTAEAAYFGHDPDESRAPRPIRTHLERRPNEYSSNQTISNTTWGRAIDMTYITTQVDVENSATMFFPHSTQAPVLMFPGLSRFDKSGVAVKNNEKDGMIVTNDSIGTVGDNALKQTVWRLEVPQGYSLGSDSKVCIKSVSSRRSNGSLTIYRNQQGVFLPAISDSDEPFYWRLEKVKTAGAETRIKDGDRIRLCWRFSDQVSGFRDYFDDLYGRRRFTRPAEVQDNLYFKVPYPRFENVKDSAGVAMVMSPAATTEPIVQCLTVLPKKGESAEQQIKYNLHDVTYRLDSVGNEGLGDAADYMNIVTSADSDEYRKNVTTNTTHEEQFTPVQSFANKLLGGGPESVIAGVLLGPAAAPVAGLVGLIGSIFDF